MQLIDEPDNGEMPVLSGEVISMLRKENECLLGQAFELKRSEMLANEVTAKAYQQQQEQIEYMETLNAVYKTKVEELRGENQSLIREMKRFTDELANDQADGGSSPLEYCAVDLANISTNEASYSLQQYYLGHPGMNTNPKG